MKRIFIAVIAAILCIATFVGCNPPTGPVETTTTPEPDVTTPNPETTTTPSVTTPPELDIPVIPNEWGNYDTITVARALEICEAAGEEAGEERYYIIATVSAVTDPAYGEMTVEDDTGSIYVYGAYSADGSKRYSELEDKPFKGDIVLLHCTLNNYKGTNQVKNARIIDFVHIEQKVDESEYTDMSIADARGAEIGAKIKLDGVVACITYANGKIPSGVILVDDTQSIYVYDGDIAGRAKVGNTVTVLGSKAYWVLDSEQSNAEKFGYRGCCQLENVKLVSIDESVKDFDKSWIPETTVKEIMDTPVTENITTAIYKVNALIEKREGTGFTNYYILDLDGKTGTYTYTQCNGSDFTWLDKFDGKICTVYLTALNAKSTASDCFFRFIPVAVIDENFTFDVADTAEYAVKYFGLTQFRKSYTGDPAAELITSVSSELLGFSGAALTYSSSNEDVVYFTNDGGKTVLHCGNSGKATVTVKGSHGGREYSATVEITVQSNETYDTVSVADAIAAAVGEEVILRGIVGPSVVNRSAFYFFDNTGMISVMVDAGVFDEIEVGHEIVIKGVRGEHKDAGRTHAGQIYIKDATVLANYYGEHDYSEKAQFITDKDLKYICDLNANEYHSTELYVVKATVTFIEDAYYTSFKVSDGDVELKIYCSGAGQYSFLKPYSGQEVTIEIAPCNWNNKSYYAGCVLAVRTADGKVINTLNFND